MVLLKILYFSFYKFVLVTPSKNEQPQHIANMTLSIFSAFNLMFALRFLKKINIINFNEGPWLLICFYAFFMFVNYFFIIKEDNYIKVIDHYNSYSNSIKKGIYIFSAIWVVFTILLVALW